ncbi:MAG TPA: porin [Burkholderiaceae bacterium]|nr:porin [Burkholderiaceae bacterium]
MKKSLLALAVLGAFVGAASAQSSVTLFGIIDTGVARIENKTGTGVKTTTNQMLNDGVNTSRLGLRGIEDLGGGLKAGFHLEGGVSPDTGGAGVGNKFWNRRATVSLLGNFGEVRLGRDYVPTFWNLTTFDPFGYNGVAQIANVISTLGSGASTLVRADNTIGYFLPSGLGGLYGQAMIAAGEGGANATQANNKYYGGRLGYAAGPFDVAAAYGQTKIDFPGSAGVVAGDKYKMWNVAGSWNFGVAKAVAQWIQGKTSGATDRKQTIWQIGAVVPLGQGEIHAAYDHANMKGGAGEPAGFRDADDANQWGIGYVYNLSKRTALYANYSHLKNKGASNFTVATPGSAAGGTSTGVQGGIRHSF